MGVGQGLASAVVKPVTGVGQALSNVGQGVTAQVGQVAGTNTKQNRRNEARLRGRLPRLVYCEQGVIRAWVELDAEVRKQLGQAHLRGVQVVLPLAEEGNLRKVVLFFADRILISEVRPEQSAAGDDAPRRQSLVSQALRPVQLVGTTVSSVAGTVGLGGIDGVSEVTEDPGDPAVFERTKCFLFNSLRKVREDDAGYLELLDSAGNPLSLRPACDSLGPDARAALKAGFLSAEQNPRGAVNWEPLHRAMQSEERLQGGNDSSGAVGAITEEPAQAKASSSSSSAARAIARRSSGGGVHVLEVWELQSRMIPTYYWQTPFLPTDFETSWRWADANTAKHPNLRKDITKEEAVKSDVPPCELEMYQPISSWKLTIDKDTDKEGWKYAVRWNASTWSTSPGFIDAVRKRRWTRQFA